MIDTYNTGDVVQLKSGGRPFTVTDQCDDTGKYYLITRDDKGDVIRVFLSKDVLRPYVDAT